MKGSRSQRRPLLFCAIILLALFIYRPGANGLRKRIVNSVGMALGRKVDVDWVKVRILPQPGFDLVNFVVHDDPSFSAEPMLRAQEDPAFWVAHQERAAEVDRRIGERPPLVDVAGSTR